jgi:outer membrane PBP1 activator LpoA protein
VFFLAAGPEQGRQIRPQLRFHDAGEKPVVAMGRIYSGALNPARDQDLNDIVFPFISGRTETRDAPSMPVFSSVRGGSLGNLYALGADAWGLIAWLPLMRKDPDLAYPGAVGSLRVSSGNRLSRQPAWWQFTNGRPQPFAWPAME